MYQVSKAYKDSMKRPVRNQSYMKVMLGLINQEAQESAVLQNVSQYNVFSDPTSIFSQNKVKRYATFERDFFVADGSMAFIPRDTSLYTKRGITSHDLFDGEFSIKVEFGSGESDIKGLSVQFGENYPSSFRVVTSDGIETQFINNNSYFETDIVFNSTSSIEIKIDSMIVADNRVRLDYIQFGLGLEYGNDWIISANSNTSRSAINEDLPESDFTLVLNNEEQIFNVDNPSSAINFLESGQEINASLGYKLDDGTVEWQKLHRLYVYEWSADDSKATIKSVDILKFISDTYYKGQYYPNGINLYDLAVLVFEDAGIPLDMYYLDTYLKKVTVYNPLPVVTHKEAFQIIANAGRCVLDYDRYGRIRIYSSFIPTYESYSNGTVYLSDVKAIDINSNRLNIASYENDYWPANGKMLFPKRNGINDVGYVSESISNAECLFDINPIITRVLESLYKSYGMLIRFSGNLPSKFIIRTYANEELNDTVIIESGIEKEIELQYDFKEFDKIEIEFISTSKPYNRIHIDYISLGSETSYIVEYDDLYSTPVGTQLDKIKNLKVARCIYSESNAEEELLTEELVYDGESQVYYTSEASYGYTSVITDRKEGQSINIVNSGAYYVEVDFVGVTIGETVKFIVSGHKYNITKSYFTKTLNNRGTDKEWENPIVSDYSHCKLITDWLADYFSSGIEYELDYRGEPAIDVGDVIGQENKYDPKLRTLVEESQFTFDGTIGGALKTRRIERVERT